MPIRPDQKARYPDNWAEISAAIRKRADDRCECMGHCGLHLGLRCPEVNGQPAMFARGTIVLTVAHLDHTPENCDPSNLRAMCQRCHLRYDRGHHAETRRATGRARSGQMLLGDWGE